MDRELRPLFEAATAAYRHAGIYAWNFSRGKLRHDPVFFSLLRRGLLPQRGSLYDLGCGQGVLLSLLGAARQTFDSGRWPAGWPPPPKQLEMHGIELREDRVQAARKALNGAARVALGDIRAVAFAACHAVVILDVLLYIEPAAQRQLLARVAAALQPGGVLLMREADAGAGLPFHITQWAERLIGMARGRLWQTLYYRRTGEWISLLEEIGFSVTVETMSEGTPFANVLFVAKK